MDSSQNSKQQFEYIQMRFFSTYYTLWSNLNWDRDEGNFHFQEMVKKPWNVIKIDAVFRLRAVFIFWSSKRILEWNGQNISLIDFISFDL